MSVGRIIETRQCIEEGTAFLVKAEPRFQTAIDAAGLPPLRRRGGGFAALLDAIVSQQISVAAANSIWSKLKAADLISAKTILRASEEDLRNCGLSGAKIRYAKALAAHKIPYRSLPNMTDEQVVAKLVEVKGIGRWTAEIYAMFSLGRADVFAPGDLALQEAAKMLFELDERPTEKELVQMAKEWAPWRAVSARILWSYYRVEKMREGIRSG